MDFRTYLWKRYEHKEVCVWIREFSVPRAEQGSWLLEGILQVFDDFVIIANANGEAVVKLADIVMVEEALHEDEEQEDETDTTSAQKELRQLGASWKKQTLEDFNQSWRDFCAKDRDISF
jgi:hypothetical protein